MRRGLVCVVSWLLACGARTSLDPVAIEPVSVDASTVVDVAATCTDPSHPWLVFELEDAHGARVYAMRSDGSHGHTVPLAHSDAIYASISLDGTKLLYVADWNETDAGDSATLFLEDLATHVTTSVVTGDSLSYSSLSADGQTVVYTLGLEVHAVNVDGTNDQLLLQPPQDAPWGDGHPLFVGTSNTFLYGFGGAFGSANADGSNVQTLVDEQNTGFDYPNPGISPDLTELVAAVQCPDDDQTWLRVYPRSALPGACESGSKLAMTEGFSSAPNEAADPSWGPTGTIAYADAEDVYLVDPSTPGTPRNLTYALTHTADADVDNFSAYDPIWAPACAPIP